MKLKPSEPFAKYIVLENGMAYNYEMVKDNVKKIDDCYYFEFTKFTYSGNSILSFLKVLYMTNECTDFKLIQRK